VRRRHHEVGVQQEAAAVLNPPFRQVPVQQHHVRPAVRRRLAAVNDARRVSWGGVDMFIFYTQW